MVKPLVSIIVPVYNSEDDIKDCLESLINQTFKNYEVIFIDDGSTDLSAEIILSYCSKYNNIKYFYQKNSGVSVARNKGIMKATGEFLSFVDSDDLISPFYLETLVNGYSSTSVDCVIADVQSDGKFCGQNNNVNYELMDDLNEFTTRLFTNFKGFLVNKLYRAELVKNNSLFLDPDIKMCEDLKFNFNYFRNCRKVAYSCNAIYYYRISNNSASNRLNNQSWFDCLKVYAYIIKEAKDFFSEEQLQQTVYRNYAYLLYEGKYRAKKNNHAIYKYISGELEKYKRYAPRTYQLFFIKHFPSFFFFLKRIIRG